MSRHKYYVIAMVPCNVCGGTNRVTHSDDDGDWEERCDACNEQGDVEVRVPLVEALAELQVRGMLPTIG